MDARARTRTGVWLMVASGLTFSLSGSFARSLMDSGWSPGAILLVRLIGAAALLIVIAAVVDLPGLRSATEHLRTLTVYGVLALALVQATFFLAIEHLSVGVALMIQFLAPIVVIAWDWGVRGRTPSTWMIVGAALALTGAVLVIDVFGAAEVSVVGIGWASVSMIGNACFFIASERAEGGLGPVVLLAGGMTVAAAVVGGIVACGLFPATFAAHSTDIAGHHVPWIVALALLIVGCTVTPYLCGVAGGARIGSTLMSLVLLCEVGFGVVFAWLMVGQSITVTQLVGGAAVVGGIALAHAGGAALPVPDEPAPHIIAHR